MWKFQVFLREDQKTALQSLSARTGVRQSGLVRQSVDLLLEGASRPTGDWREATRAAAGLWQGRKDLVRASWRSFLYEPSWNAAFLSERPDLIDGDRFSLNEGEQDR